MADRYWVGGSGTWDSSSTANWSASSGGAAGATAPTNVDVAIFDANSGTGTVTVTSTAVSLNTTINNSNISLSLSGSPTLCVATGTLTLTSGSISLNTNTLTCGRFSSSNTNARTISFGTGNITLTGNAANIWFTTTATNLTLLGTPLVNCTYSGSTGTRSIVHGATADGSESNAISFNITAGTDIVAFDVAGTPSVSAIGNLNFTGFTGTAPQTYGVNIYGNVTLNSGMTFGTGGLNFAGTSGLQTYTTNGVTGITTFSINCPNSVVRLLDNLTALTTATVTLTAGTLDLNNLTLSTGIFNSNNSNVRTIAFGTGNITLTQNGTSIWRTDTSTGLSITGTPTVNLTYAGATGTRTITAGSTTGGGEAVAINLNVAAATDTVNLSVGSHIKNLTFTGFTGTAGIAYVAWGNLTLSAGMTISGSANGPIFSATSGTTTITTNSVAFDRALTFNGVGGTFAFQDALTQGSTRAFTITNGTVQLKNGATSAVGSFVATSATVKFLQSTTLGSQATLSQASGTVNVVDLTIRDINAVGDASWNAYTDFENTDAGNNDGWDFSLSPPYTTAELPVTLRSFTQPRRF